MRKLQPIVRSGFLFVIVAVAFVGPASIAQMVGGTISGDVVDVAGASIPGTQVVILNDETGSERKITTAASGTFSAPSVSVGNYTVSLSHDGFAPLTRTGIVLTVGQNVQLHLTMNVGNVSESVSVVDSPAVVETSTLQSQGLIDERQIKELPLNGRSFDQLIQLNPASVSYTTQRAGGVGTSNSSVGNMYSVSGRRPQDNLFLLNGIEYTGASLINVTPGGTSGQLLGVDAVREFNVVSDTYGANYGKRTGAQVSIITASGGNKLHGSAYEFIRNSALDARNYFDQSKVPEFQRNNFGAALGGALRHDKLFGFGNYEGYRQHLGVSALSFVPDDASRAAASPIVKPLLALWPVANGPELLNANGTKSGIAEAFTNPPQYVREDFGTARVDTNLSQNDLLFGVYTVDDSDANTPSQNPLSTIFERLREQVVSAQEQHVFSPNLLNTFRVGYSRAAYFFTGQAPEAVPGWVAGKPIGAIVIAGSTASNGASQVTLAGANTGSNNQAVRNLFTLDEHVFYTRGRHQLEVGIWLQRLQSNDNLAQNQYGQASFSNLSSFLKGTVATFTVVPAPTALGWRSLFGAGFIEDAWKVTPRLELRAGFRTESTNGWNEAHGRASNYRFSDGVIDTNPTIGSSALSDNRAKFMPEPRVGLAYDLFGNGKTALRSSFGVHRALLDTLDYRLDQTAPYNSTLSFSNTTVDKLAGLAGGEGKSTALISPSNVQPDIATPTVLAWTFKIEQQIAPATSLTIGYVGSHGYHQILSEDQNTPPTVTCPAAPCPADLAPGKIFYAGTTKANPKVANTTSWVSQGISNYNGLEVDVRRQLSHGLQLRGVYTYASNLDDGSAWNTSVSANTPAFVMYPGNPGLDYGPAATNIRHAGAVNGTWDMPLAQLAANDARLKPLVEGWSLSGITTVQTGFPLSPQLGYNPTGNGDTRNPARPNRAKDFSGPLYPKTVKQFFNPAAFSAPEPGTFGNVGRDSLTGPGLTNLDLSLAKSTTIHERFKAQFRAEVFNVLNHSNFTTPNPVVFSSGPTPKAPTTEAQLSPTAGVVTATATTSRQIQFGLKLLF